MNFALNFSGNVNVCLTLVKIFIFSDNVLNYESSSNKTIPNEKTSVYSV